MVSGNIIDGKQIYDSVYLKNSVAPPLPHEIKLPDYQKLTEEEDFIRKMKRLKMPDETIQHFLNSFQKEK